MYTHSVVGSEMPCTLAETATLIETATLAEAATLVHCTRAKAARLARFHRYVTHYNISKYN